MKMDFWVMKMDFSGGGTSSRTFMQAAVPVLSLRAEWGSLVRWNRRPAAVSWRRSGLDSSSLVAGSCRRRAHRRSLPNHEVSCISVTRLRLRSPVLPSAPCLVAPRDGGCVLRAVRNKQQAAALTTRPRSWLQCAPAGMSQALLDQLVRIVDVNGSCDARP